MERLNSLVNLLIIIIVVLLIGFFIGRSTVTTKVKKEVELIRLDPIHDTIYQPTLIKEYTPINVDTFEIFNYCLDNNLYDYLIKSDSILVYESVDTLKILEDWLLKRDYNSTIFDNDSLGKLEVTTSIQYNKLQNFSYSFDPIQKSTVITKEKVRLIEPFVMVGTSTDLDIRAGFGIYYKKFGISYQYQNNFNGLQSHGLNLYLRF